MVTTLPERRQEEESCFARILLHIHFIIQESPIDIQDLFLAKQVTQNFNITQKNKKNIQIQTNIFSSSYKTNYNSNGFPSLQFLKHI